VFESYDAAYAVVESYYADVCYSDDRECYRIEVLSEELPSPLSSPLPLEPRRMQLITVLAVEQLSRH
jgi:hypothetical protein